MHENDIFVRMSVSLISKIIVKYTSNPDIVTA